MLQKKKNIEVRKFLELRFFFLSYQKRLRVYIKCVKVNKWFCLTHYHCDQILTSPLWAYLHIESVTWLTTKVKNSTMILILQQKEVLNFNIVSETQPKIKKNRTYLFVLQSSCECISPKKGSPKIRFETISCSHLVSHIWWTPRTFVWAGQNFPRCLET